MKMLEEKVITAAVEGIVDEAVVRKLIAYVGAVPGAVYGKQGKSNLEQRISGYNNAARFNPWFVLVDLDQDYECAPPMRSSWISDPAPYLCFRIAVREVEAWLMADAERLAAFLSVAGSSIPNEPEHLDDPKTVMVNLARRSRRRAIQEDMVPRENSGRVVGPAYTSRLSEFTFRDWRPHVAARRAGSLQRAIDCLKRLVGEIE
jgi:hypothetical protein